MYDDSHRFIEVHDVANGKVRLGQKGYWNYLLCLDCEARFGRYERHSRRLFVDPLPQHVCNSNLIREHERLDYRMFKLFCLSVLWRCSVSETPVYKHIRLGPHEEIIRNMLLKDCAGERTVYPVSTFALFFKGGHFKDIMVEPTYMRIEGQKCYRFVIMGFVIIIIVSSQNPPKSLKLLTIAPSLPIRTLDTEVADFKFLKELWDEVGETTKDVKI